MFSNPWVKRRIYHLVHDGWRDGSSSSGKNQCRTTERHIIDDWMYMKHGETRSHEIFVTDTETEAISTSGEKNAASGAGVHQQDCFDLFPHHHWTLFSAARLPDLLP
jgi:hypothetical protein